MTTIIFSFLRKKKINLKKSEKGSGLEQQNLLAYIALIWWTLYIFLEKNVVQDQLASQKPADQDQHCFLLYMLINGLDENL